MKFSTLFNAQCQMKLKVIALAIAVLFIPFLVCTSQAQVAINGAQEVQFGNSLVLRPGSQLYVYGMKGGGCCATSPFLAGQSISVTNAAGVTAAEFGVSTVNSNSFTTGDAYYVIGGFGASDYKYVQAFYGVNPGPAIGTPTSFSMTGQVSFVLSAPATVVVVAMGDVAQTVSGLPNLVTDAPSPNSQGYVAFEIDHANLEPGTYTARVATVPEGASQILNEQVTLIGVFIFSDQPDAATSSNPEIPLLVLTDTVFQFPACVNGLQVDINGGASPGTSVTSIDWNWSDGQQTTGFFPQSHTYSSQGEYTVQVTANYNDGTSASSSQIVTVGPGVLSGCDSLTITSEEGGSISYDASVGSGTVSNGESITLQLAYADDLSLIASPCSRNFFSDWSASSGITGLGGAAVPTNSTSITIVVADDSQITGSFLSPYGVESVANWSGYVVGMPDASGTYQSDAVSDVKGTWVIPEVQNFSRGEGFATWIGIGGFTDPPSLTGNVPLVQIGTALTYTTGRYYAWYEVINVLGGGPVIRFPVFPVNPGDTISAEVSFVGKRPLNPYYGWYKLTIDNVSRSVSRTHYVLAPFNTRKTAEWIVEDPLFKLPPLTDFGIIKFSNCSVTLVSEGPITSSGSGFSLAMTNNNGVIQAEPSPVSCDGTGFSVIWDHK